MKTRNRFRWAWLALAWTSLAVGLAGLVVPIMPTSPFLIVAAYAAARGSRRLYFRLVRDKRFGPMIRDWLRHGAINRPAKIMATLAMSVSAVGVLWLSPWIHVAWVIVGILVVVVLWLWSRPDPPRHRAR